MGTRQEVSGLSSRPNFGGATQMAVLKSPHPGMTRPNTKCSSYLGDRVRLEVLDWGGSVRPVVLLGGVGKVRTYLRRLRRKIMEPITFTASRDADTGCPVIFSIRQLFLQTSASPDLYQP